jgi:hypothetical protein
MRYSESDPRRALEMAGTAFENTGVEPLQEVTLHKPEGTRRVGIPAIRWLDSVEEYFQTMGLRNWRRKPQDRDQWRVIVKEAKVHRGLYRP